MREGSAPNFCPPTEEGITLTFQDEKGDQIDLEFLGLILHEGRRYGSVPCEGNRRGRKDLKKNEMSSFCYLL